MVFSTWISHVVVVPFPSTESLGSGWWTVQTCSLASRLRRTTARKARSAPNQPRIQGEIMKTTFFVLVLKCFKVFFCFLATQFVMSSMSSTCFWMEGYLGRLVTRISDNLELQLRDLHIRFQDCACKLEIAVSLIRISLKCLKCGCVSCVSNAQPGPPPASIAVTSLKVLFCCFFF